MAKENLVLLYGIVEGKPRIYESDGEAIQAMFVMSVMRRFTNEKGVTIRARMDMVTLITRTPEVIKDIRQLQEFDMVDIKGVFTTLPAVKRFECPYCKHKTEINGQYAFVTPLSVRKRKHVEDRKAGFEELKNENEISNMVLCIGTVCQTPRLYVSEDGLTVCQYPLAVNRKVKISADDPTNKTDWPWVKTFGEQAKQDMDTLAEGATVYVDGSFQVRKRPRKIECEQCGQVFEKQETISEINPYSVEYLFNNKNKSNEDDYDGWNFDYELPIDGLGEADDEII